MTLDKLRGVIRSAIEQGDVDETIGLSDAQKSLGFWPMKDVRVTERLTYS